MSLLHGLALVLPGRTRLAASALTALLAAVACAWSCPEQARAVDTTPPTTTLAVSPSAPDGQNGWYRSTPTLILTSDEPATTWYRLSYRRSDHPFWQESGQGWAVYSGPIIGFQAELLLQWYSVDAAGNREQENSRTVYVDSEAPQWDNGWLRFENSPGDALTFGWNGARHEDASPIDRVELMDGQGSLVATFAPGPYSEFEYCTVSYASMNGYPLFCSASSGSISKPTVPGTYSYRARLVDRAGNVSNPSSLVTVTVGLDDTTPPQVALGVYEGAPDGANGWYLTVPNFELTSDEPVRVWYRVAHYDSSSPTETPHLHYFREWRECTFNPILHHYCFPATGGGLPDYPFDGYEGSVLVECYAVDASGNRSGVLSRTLNVDTDIPSFLSSSSSSGPSTVTFAWRARGRDASNFEWCTEQVEIIDAVTGSVVATSSPGVVSWDPWTPIRHYLPASLSIPKPTFPGTYHYRTRIVDAAGHSSSLTNTFTVTVAATRQEQSDAKVTYTGAWTTATANAFSGTSLKYGGAGCDAAVAFTGTGIELVALTGPTYGIANITLDSAETTSVDLYSPTYAFKRVVWTRHGLTYGAHLLRVKYSGSKNAASSSARINVDSFDIVGTLVQGPSRYEQSDARITYGGAWTTATASACSGSSLKYGSVGCEATVSFTGTGIDVVALTGPTYGIANITLDSAEMTSVDLYSPTYEFKRLVFGKQGLTNGPHLLRVQYSGLKNAASSNARINVDSFEVVGSLTQGPSRYEQSDPRLAYTGMWTTATASSFSASSLKYGSIGCEAAVSFTGTGVEVVALTGPTYGIANITLDSGGTTPVDLYSPVYAFKRLVYGKQGLASGPHLLRVQYSGLKNPASSSVRINVDAFDIVGVLNAP